MFIRGIYMEFYSVLSAIPLPSIIPAVKTIQNMVVERETSPPAAHHEEGSELALSAAVIFIMALSRVRSFFLVCLPRNNGKQYV